MKTLLQKPFHWAVMVWVLSCWLPSGVMAQRSEWYELRRPYTPLVGAADIFPTSLVGDAAGNVYQGFSFRDSLLFNGGPFPDTTIRGHSLTQQAVCVLAQAPDGRRRWCWSPQGGSGRRRRLAAIVRTGPTTLAAMIEIRGTLIAGADTVRLPATDSVGIVLVRLTTAGQVQWARLVARSSSAPSQYALTPADDLAVDGDGNFVVAGTYAGTASVGNIALPVSSQQRGFLARLDSSGTVQWVRTVGGSNESKGRYACVDATGNIYFSGTYRAQVTIGGFQLGVIGATSDQVFVAKYNANGQVQWAKGMGSTTGTTSNLSRPVVHPSGDLLLHIFGPTQVFGAPHSDGRNLLRVRPDGILRWSRFTVGYDLSCDRLGNIYSTGFYAYNGAAVPSVGNGIVLPPAPVGNRTSQAALMMYDEELVPQWAITVAGINNGTGAFEKAPLVTPDGRVYAIGYVSNTVIIAGDTLRRGIGGGWQYLWKVRPPLTFGEAGQRLVCAGATYRVPFTRDSTRFAAGQAVVAELSDATGSFTTPTVIGAATGAAERDTLTLTIPATATPGAGYRVRLKTSAPYLLSAGEGLALEITPAAVARILAPDTVGVCPAASLPVLRGQASFGAALQWTRNGQPLPGATTDRLALTQPGTYALTVSGGPCGPATSPSVEVLPVPTPTLTLTPLSQVLLTGASFALTGATPVGGIWSGPGVSNNRFNPATAGLGTHTLTYTYTSRFGCAATATTTLEVVRVLGVGAETGIQALTLSPNPAPATARLTFRTAQPQAATVALYDALGRLIHEQTLPTGTEHATTLTLPAVSGAYQVRVMLTTGVVTRTLLVQP